MTKKLFNEQNEIVNLSRKLFRIKVNARFWWQSANSRRYSFFLLWKEYLLLSQTRKFSLREVDGAIELGQPTNNFIANLYKH